MSSHLLGFQSFFRFLHRFVFAKLDTSSVMVKWSPGSAGPGIQYDEERDEWLANCWEFV